MNSLTRTIINNIHPTSLIISAAAVMCGLTASIIRGGISVFPAIMTLLFAVLLQASANLYHGYFYFSKRSNEIVSVSEARRSVVSNSSRVTLLRIVANGIGILAVTAGMTLFSFIGWIGLLYIVIIAALLYFYFMAPRPVVRTKWSILFTFLLFGPVAVSGTALTQDLENPNWIPVFFYSIISGLLASNAHISIQYLRYEEDCSSCNETLVTAKGGFFTRFVYLGNAIIVSIILILRPSAVDFVSPWVGFVIGLSLLFSSIWVFSMMHRDPIKVSWMVRSVTLWQYIVVTIALMAIVIYSIDQFDLNIFHYL